MQLSQSFSKDIKTLSLMVGNMWQDCACAGILLSLSSAVWLDVMVLPLGRAAIPALVVGVMLLTSVLLAA